MARATSSACEGPESTAIGCSPPVSCAMTCDIRRCVPRSMPFVTESSGTPSGRYGAASFATACSANDGGANTTSSAFLRQFRSFVICNLTGSCTPGSKGFSLFSFSCSAFLGSCDQSVTVCRFCSSSMARAVPQPPLPSTTMFMPLPPISVR